MFIKFPVLYPQLFPLISGSRAHERNKDDKKTAWSGTVAHIMRLQYPRFRLSILVDTSPWSSLIKVTSSVFCPLSVVLHFVSFAGLSFDLKIKKINEIHFKKKLNKNSEWVLIPSQNFNNWDNENLVVIILIIFIAIHIFQFFGMTYIGCVCALDEMKFLWNYVYHPKDFLQANVSDKSWKDKNFSMP